MVLILLLLKKLLPFHRNICDKSLIFKRTNLEQVLLREAVCICNLNKKDCSKNCLKKSLIIFLFICYFSKLLLAIYIKNYSVSFAFVICFSFLLNYYIVEHKNNFFLSSIILIFFFSRTQVRQYYTF